MRQVDLEPLIITLLLLLVGVVVLGFVLWGRGRHRGRPSCGKCGYAVEGLTQLICPECGADLRKVGIATATGGARLSRAARGILWTIILPMFACPLSGVLLMFVAPQRETSRQTRQFLTQSKAFRVHQMELVGSTTRWAWESVGQLPPETASVDLATDGGDCPILHIDLETFGFQYADPQGGLVDSADAVDLPAVLTWMRVCDIDVESELVQREAEDLLHVLANARTVSHTRPQYLLSMGGSSQSMNRPVGWATVFVLGMWLPLWLVGLRWVIGKNPESRAPSG